MSRSGSGTTKMTEQEVAGIKPCGLVFGIIRHEPKRRVPMGNLNVTYKASSLESLADGLDAMAADKRTEAGMTSTQRRQRDLIHEAIGFEQAADVVRNTVIDPSMEGDHA